jgi:FKBP-type peptidyl-prolyl cis-trans isomerase
MKQILFAFVATALLAFNASAQPAAQPPTTPRVPPALAPRTPPGRPPGAPTGPPPPMPDKDKLSYAIGMSIGNNIKRDKLELDMDAVAAAMKDVMAGKPTRFTDAELKEIMTQFQGAMRAKMAAEREKEMSEMKAKGEENKVKGAEYLAKNAKATGVTALTNGLQYKVLKEGSGPKPNPTDTVTVSYKGSLIDGTVFDQNDHFTTPVTGRTIKGWSEILPMMNTGSKYEVTIPSDLGYSQRGFPPKIGPNCVLIFEMELLSISPPPPTPPAPAPSTTSHPAPPAPPAAGAPGTTTTPVVSGQIIKVPSAEELKKGAKIEVITNTPNTP